MCNDFYIDDDERCSDEEAAEAFKEYQFAKEASDYWQRIDAEWENLLAECDSKRKERRESA